MRDRQTDRQTDRAHGELALYIYQLLLHFLHVCRSRSWGNISRKRRSWYIYTAEEELTYTLTYKLVVGVYKRRSWYIYTRYRACTRE